MNRKVKDQNKSIVFVLGMHRCGTSALTGAINFIGAGTGGDTLAGSEDNPLGYFENEEMLNINEGILNELGYSWDSITFCETDLVKNISYKKFLTARKFLENLYETSDSLVVLKDPRVSLLYPFWRDVAESASFSILPVVTYRNPIEVALSEMKRAHSDRPYHFLGHKLDYTLRLWFIHYYELFRSLDRDFCLVSYDQLLFDTHKTLKAIGDFVDIPYSKEIVNQYQEDFLNTDLKRENGNEYLYDLEPSKNSFIWELFEILKTAHKKKDVHTIKDAAKFIKPFKFMENVKQFNGPIKEFPSMIKAAHI